MSQNYFNLPPHPYKGTYIILEGPDGAGKSTQYRRLVDKLSKKYNTVQVREPGGTPVGEKIRETLLARVQPGMDMEITTELLLYQASRAELMGKRILPALKEGHIVLADRGPYASYAYQGSAGGMAHRHLDMLTEISMSNVRPDIALFYDLDESAAAKRLSPLLDRMEAKGAAFHRKVRQGYLDIAKQDKLVRIIDASQDTEKVWKDTESIIDEWMAKNPKKESAITRI